MRQMNDCLSLYRDFLTCDSARKGRLPDDVDRWKASEYRQFLLYIGPAFLKDVLDAKKYDKFLWFSICMHLMCNSRLAQHYLTFVQGTLIKAVHQSAAPYGKSELVYNVHKVVHLCDKVRLRGSMDAFSAVPYESYLSTLKRLLRSPALFAPQLFRGFAEKVACDNDDEIKLDDVISSACWVTLLQMENGFMIGQTFFSDRPPNNRVIIGGKPAVLELIQGSRILTRRYSQNNVFFEECICPVGLRIFQCSRIQLSNLWRTTADIQCNCKRFLFKDIYIMYPILHTMDN
ncbi:hypothetical protein PHET_10566 [Paragonimus heterotremus]|uniref:Uncharacterized protein n=1 Tax=Paragonimus heterotremus TaxID=100268 RepID=A0A8J4WCS2_9TREM|nr:hypothetical protein PHET_10566 [Paragonimus heterotremus]